MLALHGAVPQRAACAYQSRQGVIREAHDPNLCKQKAAVCAFTVFCFITPTSCATMSANDYYNAGKAQQGGYYPPQGEFFDR